MQEGKPAAYMSQTLSDQAQLKYVYERELMAIILAIQKWRHYLLGRFVVLTDQKSLKFLVDQRMMGEDQHKWEAKLLGFDFEIRYKAGKENRAADAFSRKVYYSAILAITFQDQECLEQEVQWDDKLKLTMQNLIQGNPSQQGFEIKGGTLYYKGRLVVPKRSPRIPLIQEVIRDFSGVTSVFLICCGGKG